MKPITGQYEFAHQSGIGLDYFTSRLDRLTIYPNGRFLLSTQDHSRLSNAAQSLMSGQQVSAAAPETRREGNYILQGNAISFRFDDGSQEQGQIPWNGEGIQLGQNLYNKVSDSTMIPPTQRVKKDMDDIAKGLKIAGTIGGMALKAAKTVHSTIQAVQETGTSQPNPFLVQQQGQGPNQGGAAPSQPGYQTQPPQAQQSQPQGSYVPPVSVQGGSAPYVPPASVQPASPAVPPSPRQMPRAGAPIQPAPPPQQPPVSPPPAAPTPSPAPRNAETRFCDQCGAPARPGKRFCNQCGAELP